MAENEASGQPDEAAHAVLPFSRYVAVGEWIYLSGVVGRDPRSGLLDCKSIREQTLVALGVIEDILGEARACLGDVVKVTLCVTDLTLFDEINHAYREVFISRFPARTCV